MIVAVLVCAAIGCAVCAVVKAVKIFRELPEIDFTKPDPWADYNE